MLSELLELWMITVCSARSNIALDDVATATSAELLLNIFTGRTPVVIELDLVPLVLRDGSSEFGAEYSIGSESIS